MSEVQENAAVPNGKTKRIKSPSLVSVIRAEWVAAGAKQSDKASIKLVFDSWRTSEKLIQAAEAAIVKAREEGYAASLKLAKMTGCTALDFDGDRHEFSSRNGKVFLRVKNDRSVSIEL